MNKYKINFSKENNIGGAFDEYNQMVASIEGGEGVYELKFRSADFETSIDMNQDPKRYEEIYKFVIPDGRAFCLIKEKKEDKAAINLMIDDEVISDELLDESFTIDINDKCYYYKWLDETKLELKTESNEIVEAISIGLILLVLRNDHESK